MSRFAYEVAEKELDAFAAKEGTLSFKRSYRKLKFMLAAYAFVDFDNRYASCEEAKDRAMSFAWEDVQMAFTGHGEWALAGCILQMWTCLSPKKQARFFEVVKAAFEAAEEATSPEAPRRYMHRFRTKPPRKPGENWTLPTILPMSGKTLSDWALDNGEDPREVLREWYWLERADRAQYSGMETPEPEPGKGPEKRARLRLVPDQP
jgi:hypothetical protein